MVCKLIFSCHPKTIRQIYFVVLDICQDKIRVYQQSRANYQLHSQLDFAPAVLPSEKSKTVGRDHDDIRYKENPWDSPLSKIGVENFNPNLTPFLRLES